MIFLMSYIDVMLMFLISGIQAVWPERGRGGHSHWAAQAHLASARWENRKISQSREQVPEALLVTLSQGCGVRTSSGALILTIHFDKRGIRNRSGRDSMIVKIINFSVFLSSIILPANCSLLNFCSKPQIHWGFLHELFKLKEDDCFPLSNSLTM